MTAGHRATLERQIREKRQRADELGAEIERTNAAIGATLAAGGPDADSQADALQQRREAAARERERRMIEATELEKRLPEAHREDGRDRLREIGADLARLRDQAVANSARFDEAVAALEAVVEGALGPLAQVGRLWTNAHDIATAHKLAPGEVRAALGSTVPAPAALERLLDVIARVAVLVAEHEMHIRSGAHVPPSVGSNLRATFWAICGRFNDGRGRQPLVPGIEPEPVRVLRTA